MTKERKMRLIGEALDRYERITGQSICNRFDRFIDLDVSRVDVEALHNADDGTFMHDCNGIFDNLERDGEHPEKSVLRMFEPRVGFEKDDNQNPERGERAHSDGGKYTVYYSFYLSASVDIEAASEEEAEQKCKEMIARGELAADLNDMEVGEHKVWVE